MPSWRAQAAVRLKRLVAEPANVDALEAILARERGTTPEPDESKLPPWFRRG